MSHFSTVKSQYKNLDRLLKAIVNAGQHYRRTWQPQVHDDPVHLHGYMGDRREQVANIVVPRDQISGASNDLGWVFNPETQSYDTIISDYDRGHLPQFVMELSAQYALLTVQEEFGLSMEIEDIRRSIGGIEITVTQKNELATIGI